MGCPNNNCKRYNYLNDDSDVCYECGKHDNEPPEVGKSGLVPGYIAYGWIVRTNTGYHKFFLKENRAKHYAIGYGEDEVEEIFPVFKKTI